MGRAIVVVTYPGSPWLFDCIQSLRYSKYPITLIFNQPLSGRYDDRGLYVAKELGLTHFILLHDSLVVHDIKQLDELMERPGCIPVGPLPNMHIGKYELAEIQHLLPELEPNSKTSAVAFESRIVSKFPWKEPLYKEFRDPNATEEYKNGRNNKVLKCPLMTKWKGSWTFDQIQAVDRSEGREVPWFK